MKLPNGYGSIVKMSGKRRKPYAVRITDGTKLNKDGRRIQKYRFLEYFENRSDALTYLANYNSNSAVKEHSEYIKNPTLKEMYDEWITLRTSGKNAISPLTRRNYDIAINRFEKLHNKKFCNIQYQELQIIVTENADKSKATMTSIRAALNGMYELAIKKGIVTQNLTSLINYEWTDSTEPMHKRFTDDEIQKLWDNCYKMHNVDAILIEIYTGLRPSELCEIECENINIKEQYMIGGMKTKAGTNRIIPICDRILPLVKARYNEGRKYLISNKFGNHYTYGVFYDSFNTTIKRLGMKHNPHDCRHTFASLADNVQMNEVCLKKIMGHSIQDITKGVYTDKTPAELLAEVQKLNDLF